MRRVVALVILALLLGSCAHHPPAKPSASAVPQPAAPATEHAPSVSAPPAPAVQAQHPPLWLVRGAVVDAHSGRPLENAAVQVLSRHGEPPATPPRPSIATAADGRFTIDFPAPGDYPLKVAALGYRFKTTTVHVSEGGNVPYHVFRLTLLPLGSVTPAATTPNP